MKLRQVSPLAIALTAVLTTACTTDSSNESSSKSAPSLSKSLSKVILTTSNYKAIAKESLSVSSGSVNGNQKPTNVSEKPRYGARNIMARMEDSLVYDFTNNSAEKIIYGDCSGNGTQTEVTTILSNQNVQDYFEGNVSEREIVNFKVDRTYDSMTDGNTVECDTATYRQYTGKVILNGDEVSGSGKYTNDVDVTNLKITDLQRNVTVNINGSLTFSEDNSLFPRIRTFDFHNTTFYVETSNMQEVLNNFVYVEEESAATIKQRFDGQYALDDLGYVEIHTLEPLTYTKSFGVFEIFPSSGLVTWSGDNKSIITMNVLSSTEVQLSVDEDGNGVDDSSEVLGWQDLTVPEFVNWLK